MRLRAGDRKVGKSLEIIFTIVSHGQRNLGESLSRIT